MKNRGFVSLIGLLLSLVIIIVIFFMIMNAYVKKPAIDEETEKILSEHGINTTSHKAVLESTKEIIKDINKQTIERSEEGWEKKK